MKKAFMLIVMILVLAPVSPARAAAAGDTAGGILSDPFSLVEPELDALEEELPDAARELLDGLTPAELTAEKAAQRILSALGTQTGGAVKESMGVLTLLLAVILVCGMLGAVREGTQVPGDTLNLASAVAVTTISLGGMTGLMASAGEALQNLAVYSKLLLPVLAAIQSAMGQPGAAAAKYGAAMLFSGVLIDVVLTVLFPLVYVYLLLLAADAASPVPRLTRLCGFVRWGTGLFLTVSLGLFVTYFSISGAVAGSADALAVKGAKAGLSTAIPVVGGILSDAAEMILVGGGVVKNAVGLYGLLAVAGICLQPLLGLGVRLVIFKLAAALAGPVSDERTGKLLDGLADAFGLVFGMVAACVFLFFVSILSAVLAVGG